MKKTRYPLPVLKGFLTSLFLVADVLLFSACGKEDPTHEPQHQGEEPVVPKPPVEATEYCKLEAEDAGMSGNLKVGTSYPGYSGKGYVAEFSGSDDVLTFTVPPIKTGKYELIVCYYCMYGEKKNHVSFNGNKTEFHFPKNDRFSELKLCNLTFSKEEGNTVVISKSWGYFAVDYIILKKAEDPPFNFSSTLVTPNPSEEASALYRYLLDNFEKKVLSGQTGDKESESIRSLTGRMPVIRAFDFMDYSPSRIPYGASSTDAEKAVSWHRQGGIVTIAWHWNAPKDLMDTDGHRWWSGFYTHATTFDVEYAVNHPESDDYQLIIRDIDAIAVQLAKLKQEKVPVLWRPLHEAAGKWFWWGAKGAAPCVKLYRLMFDRLVRYHGLDNLIWVWTSDNASDALEWYPGDEYVDIIGADIYSQGDYSSHAPYFESLKEIYGGRKILAISENGTIPTPSAMWQDQATWSYFVTWSGEFIEEKHNPVSHLIEVFQDEHVVTLEDYKKR